MINKTPLELIKRAILEEAEKLGVKVEQIILFGSRARGDYREDSDWDVLIIVSDESSTRDLKLLRHRLYMRLNMPVDIVTVKKSWWKRYREVPGTVAYEAAREGIVVA